MKLSQIEKRILEIKNILADKDREKKIASGLAMPVFEGRLKNANRPLLEEKDRLETERQFILDRRDSLLWRVVWNILVPILVSICTVYALNQFGLN
ncbi:MAG: hypothetical protein WCP17_02765 [bacterium]